MPVVNKQCIIDGQKVNSMAEFYEQMARQLSFPPHFGNNLDALRDVLTTDVEGPLQIIWSGAMSSRVVMGRDFECVITLLQQVARERKDIRVTVQE